MVIFISHIHEDRELAISLKRLAEDAYPGFLSVFVSSHDDDIRLGDDWFKEIEHSLIEADIIILLLSPQSVSRPWINFEAGGGWFIGKKVIPVCIKGLVPEALPPPFAMRQGMTLSTIHDIDSLFGFISNHFGREHLPFDSTQTLKLAKEPELILEDVNDKSPLVEPDNPIASFGAVDFVSNRFAEAFPGIRGDKLFTEAKIIMQRLNILLAQPLSYTRDVSAGTVTTIPFWWFRGHSAMHIRMFKIISENKCLVDIDELIPTKVLVCRDFARPEKEFLYLETFADTPSGVYAYERNLNEMAEEHHRSGYGRFVSEEFGVWENHFVTREEYDDGSAIIEGEPTRISGASLRVRFLTPYNLIICPQRSVFNNRIIEDQVKIILDGLLAGTSTLSDLLRFVENAPRPDWFDRFDA